jgi:hypothetical protein
MKGTDLTALAAECERRAEAGEKPRHPGWKRDADAHGLMARCFVKTGLGVLSCEMDRQRSLVVGLHQGRPQRGSK